MHEGGGKSCGLCNNNDNPAEAGDQKMEARQGKPRQGKATDDYKGLERVGQMGGDNCGPSCLKTDG